MKITGNKTYIGCGLLAAITVAKALGWIDEQTYLTLLGLIGAATGVALRAGIKKAER